MPRYSEFKRVVLGLQHNRSPAGLKVAMEVAALLRLEVCGFFVKEEGLANFAALPFARELNPLSGAWQSIDVERLSLQVDAAASSAERLLAEAVSRRGLSFQFQIVHGSITETIASLTRSGDIYVASVPTSPLERATGSFQLLLDTALRSAAAVLLVPSRLDRQTGSIVAVANDRNDICIDVATAIAGAAKEDLVIIEDFAVETEPQVATGAARAEVKITRLRGDQVRSWNTRDIVSFFQPLQERLVVISGNTAADVIATSIAGARRVPVLIVEPTR
jgi:hypothetical protein